MLSTVTACGLSALVLFTVVLSKVRLGIVLRSNFTSCEPETAWVT